MRWLFYTSGTTSDPKGAQHTDHTIGVTACGMCERLELMPDDRNALAFPFTHIGGIIWMVSGLYEGFTNILMEAFDPVGTVEVLQREGVTLAGSGTPFHMAYLAAQRKQPDKPLFPNVRAFPGGGAPKPPQLHADIKREMGGIGHRVGLRADRGADPDDVVDPRLAMRCWPTPRARRCRASSCGP